MTKKVRVKQSDATKLWNIKRAVNFYKKCGFYESKIELDKEI
jgi:hypothetical protein